MFFSLIFSTTLISCRETQDVAEETGEAVEEGVEEVDENINVDDDL